jgi:hypothetical protein
MQYAPAISDNGALFVYKSHRQRIDSSYGFTNKIHRKWCHRLGIFVPEKLYTVAAHLSNLEANNLNHRPHGKR